MSQIESFKNKLTEICAQGHCSLAATQNLFSNQFLDSLIYDNTELQRLRSAANIWQFFKKPDPLPESDSQPNAKYGLLG